MIRIFVLLHVLHSISATILLEQAIQETSISLFETGRISFSVQDIIASRCSRQTLNLPLNLTQYTHTASFQKMEQVRGVRFGKKSFVVDSWYLRDTHEISILVSIYGHYEWQMIRVIYFVSGDPSISAHSYSFDLWNPQRCYSETSLSQSTLQLDIPLNNYSSVVVFLRGVNCQAEKCTMNIMDSWINSNGQLQISYSYSIEIGLLGNQYPNAFKIGYILFTEQSSYSSLIERSPPHVHLLSASYPYSNQIDPTYLQTSQQQYQQPLTSFQPLIHISEQLNFYEIVYIQKQNYELNASNGTNEAGIMIISEIECLSVYNGTLDGNGTCFV